MASMRDVAKLANVGLGTVSRMLNDSGYVSEETRNRIEEAMKALDYTPNELARNLYHKRSLFPMYPIRFLRNSWIMWRLNFIRPASR